MNVEDLKSFPLCVRFFIADYCTEQTIHGACKKISNDCQRDWTSAAGYLYSYACIAGRPVPITKPGQFLHLALDQYDPSKQWPGIKVLFHSNKSAGGIYKNHVFRQRWLYETNGAWIDTRSNGLGKITVMEICFQRLIRKRILFLSPGERE